MDVHQHDVYHVDEANGYIFLVLIKYSEKIVYECGLGTNVITSKCFLQYTESVFQGRVH